MLLELRERAFEAVGGKPPGQEPPPTNGAAQETWALVLRELEKDESLVNRHSCATWFRPTSGWALEGGVLTVQAPTAECSRWLEANYRTIVAEAVVRAFPGRVFQVRFVARAAA